jgi:hypothetical protein
MDMKKDMLICFFILVLKGRDKALDSYYES